MTHTTDRSALMGDQLELYRRMWVLRLLDMALEDLRIEGLLNQAVPAAFGQEAVAIGTTAALRPGDVITTPIAHLRHAREVGLALPLGRVIAEMIGPRPLGTAQEAGEPCPSSTFEQSPLFAIGQAYSQWVADDGGVTLCFIGDGDANSDDFHEAASIAVSWRLPVVIVVESIRQVPSACPDGPVRECHGLPVVSVDGNDVEAVRDSVAEAMQRAGAGEGPILVEAVTYRTNHVAGFESVGHGEPAGSDRLLDPLVVARQRLIAAGVSASSLYEVERRARHLVAEAESFAKALSRGDELAPVRRPEAWRAAS